MGKEFSDDEFKDMVNKTFSKKSRNERKEILRKAMESDSETSRRFISQFDEAREKLDFSGMRDELFAQERFIDLGVKIDPRLHRGAEFTDENRKKFAKGGFRGTVNMKTLFTVGEGNKKEHVSRKKKNNIFDVGFKF